MNCFGELDETLPMIVNISNKLITKDSLLMVLIKNISLLIGGTDPYCTRLIYPITETKPGQTKRAYARAVATTKRQMDKTRESAIIKRVTNFKKKLEAKQTKKQQIKLANNGNISISLRSRSFRKRASSPSRRAISPSRRASSPSRRVSFRTRTPQRSAMRL